MKIRDYIQEINKMELLFEDLKYEGDRIILYDAIELRTNNVVMWYLHGLTEEDEVPEMSTKLKFVDFSLV